MKLLAEISAAYKIKILLMN